MPNSLRLHYVLIFGKFGAPALGVNGAAIGTVISRFIECGIIIIRTHLNKEFIKGVYASIYIPKNLIKNIAIKGTPLMANEFLWASGMSMLTQCYSVRGLAVVAGINIASTISNLFSIVYISCGSAVAIIIGQLLGAGKMEEAKDNARKLIFFSVMSCVVIGIIMSIIAPAFPSIYNTSEEVKDLATNFIKVLALCMPFHAFTNASYFTLRSGGKTVITFLFDSMFVWLCSIPVAFVLSRHTNLDIVFVYLICQSLEFIKCIIGGILVKSGIWVQNIVI